MRCSSRITGAFQDGVLTSLRLLATIVIPMGVGMAALADLIVRTLYGTQWLPAVPLLLILALVGITRALHALLLLIAVVVGSQWSMLGVAIGVLVFNVVLLGSTFRALQLIELDPIEVLAAIAPAASAALFMGAILVELDAMDLVPHSQPLLELLVLVATGVVLFFAGLFAISRSSISELWSMRRFLRAS